MKKLSLLLTSLIVIGSSVAQEVTIPEYKHNKFYNHDYVVHRAPVTPVIDGELSSAEWDRVPWTECFMDIEGENRPVEPKYQTRAKMMWDDHYLYFAAEMIEPHIWATFKERDAVIYYDNDIEIFLDVSGEGHNYYEFEYNAFGTEWELFMSQPYIYGGFYLTSWDLRGMKSAVKVYGTINDPSDTDEKWTIEVALPISGLMAVQYGKNNRVKDGDQWRINFSRVEWLAVDVVDGQYKKQPKKEGFGNEDNWVWTPTGVIDMHRPERWGYMQFSDVIAGQGCVAFNWNNDHKQKETLRIAAERISQFRSANHGMMPTKEQLQMDEEFNYYPAGEGFKLTIQGETGTWYKLSEDGRLERGR
ncbi:MAG: carbohydrate-binding family 9-like protein [Rikenellaceae bacterium]